MGGAEKIDFAQTVVFCNFNQVFIIVFFFFQSFIFNKKKKAIKIDRKIFDVWMVKQTAYYYFYIK